MPPENLEITGSAPICYVELALPRGSGNSGPNVRRHDVMIDAKTEREI
jgi:hypothetical protein